MHGQYLELDFYRTQILLVDPSDPSTVPVWVELPARAVNFTITAKGLTGPLTIMSLNGKSKPSPSEIGSPIFTITVEDPGGYNLNPVNWIRVDAIQPGSTVFLSSSY